LATPILIANNDYDEREYFVFKEKDPLSTDGVNRWQVGIDSWLALPERQNDGRYKYPTEYCNVGGQMTLKINEPSDRQQLDSNEVTIKTSPVSIKGIKKVEIYIDDKLVSSLDSPPYEDKINVETGKHRIKVKAYDTDKNEVESEVKVGVKVPWEDDPTPTPTPTP